MKTILVADDEKFWVEDLIEDLKTRYHVEYVSDGKQAIERIEGGGLDGAILDDTMPPRIQMSEQEAEQYKGSSIVRRARKLQPNIALVLRSTIATDFAEELKPLDVYCHNKVYGDSEVIMQYLQKKLGE